jgi:hypothetical protein
MPTDFGKKLKLNCDIKTRIKSDLRVVAWKDIQNVNMLTNMRHDEYGNILQLALVQDYTNIYGMCRQI